MSEALTPFIPKFEWPRAPAHRLPERGAYMITAATYQKECFFRSDDRLDFLLQTLLNTTADYGWDLQAWAVLANHYHFVGISPADPKTLPKMISKIHTLTAREINRQDATPGRKVWYQYWDTHITHDGSYLARLHYVQNNPVHHHIASQAQNYRWCSTAWFSQNVTRSFFHTVRNMKTDCLNIEDDF